MRVQDDEGELLEQCLHISFEMALFAAMMPGGVGYSDDLGRDKELDLGRALEISEAFSVLDYWDDFRKNPHAMQMFIAMVELMYQPKTEADLRGRLWRLGDMLVKRSMNANKVLSEDILRHAKEDKEEEGEGESMAAGSVQAGEHGTGGSEAEIADGDLDG